MTQALAPPVPHIAKPQQRQSPPADAPAIRPRLWTADQYMHLAELGVFIDQRVELIDGIIYDMAPQSNRHSIIIKLAQLRLDRAFDGIGFTVTQSTYHAGESSRPEPDLAVYPGQPRDYLREEAELSNAMLVGEVSLTTLPHDRKVKIPLYARVGIREYWIVNLIANHLEVYREPTQEADGTWRYAQMQTLTLDQPVAPLAAPDQVIAVSELMS